MPLGDMDRHRQIEHQLAGIAAVGLQFERIGIAPDLLADAVAENTFGAVTNQILFWVAGEWLAEAIVVGRYITIVIRGNGVDEIFVCGEQLFLYRRQRRASQ